MQAYEQVALQFYQDTGFYAPGRDVPSAIAQNKESDPIFRQGAWECWNKLHDAKRIKPLPKMTFCELCNQTADELFKCISCGKQVCENCYVRVRDLCRECEEEQDKEADRANYGDREL